MTSIRIFEKLTKRAEPYPEDEIIRLKGYSAFHLVRELRIKPWKVPWLLVRGRAQMRRKMDGIEVFKGMEDVLKALQAEGVQMYIISSNSPGNIRKLLKAKGMDGYFKHIYGNVGIFGKSKMLRRVIERNGIDLATTSYVGDEGRDAEAAKRVGVRAVSVTWGYNNHEVLARHDPDVLVDTPEQLRDVLLAARG